jgi:hypothetical protein
MKARAAQTRSGRQSGQKPRTPAVPVPTIEPVDRYRVVYVQETPRARKRTVLYR